MSHKARPQPRLASEMINHAMANLLEKKETMCSSETRTCVSKEKKT